MAYQHGVYVTERGLNVAMTSSLGGGIPVVIGTAPVHLVSSGVDLYKPVLCYNLQEYTKNFGYNDNFENYTLNEAAYVIFNLYNTAPCAFINVLDLKRHYKETVQNCGGISENAAVIVADLDINSLKITSGKKISPTSLTADTDYSITRTQEDEVVTVTLRILQSSEIVDDKVKIYYKTSEDGDEIERVINNVTAGAVNLDRDTIVDSVKIETGGVNTLVELTEDEISAEYSEGVLTLTLLDDRRVIDDEIDVSYHEVDVSKVTTADIIGKIDEAGRATGIELVDAVAPLFSTNSGGNIVSILAGTLLAPKYSCDERVATALKAKAAGVSGMFPAMAIVDLDTETAKNYQSAADLKIKNAINDSRTIVCWPKVKLADKQTHLSTHLAALMQRVDAENDDIPYVSPSNHVLSIGCTCLSDGTEVYLTRDMANYLNGNGVSTAINLSGWRFWSNETSAMPSTQDPKEKFISVRRMFNFLTNTLMTTFFTTLDSPLNRRMIDSVLNKVNLYLAGLASKGAILGGNVEFTMADNSVAELADGKVTFVLNFTPCSPARVLNFKLVYDASYIETLFS